MNEANPISENAGVQIFFNNNKYLIVLLAYAKLDINKNWILKINNIYFNLN